MRIYKVLAPAVPRLGLLFVLLKNQTAKNSRFHDSIEKLGKKGPDVSARKEEKA